MGHQDAVFGQVAMTQALDSHERFKSGAGIELAGGWSHAFSPGLGAVLQLNVRRKSSDRGAQAEPDNSGSTAVQISPGMTVGVGPIVDALCLPAVAPTRT